MSRQREIKRRTLLYPAIAAIHSGKIRTVNVILNKLYSLVVTIRPVRMHHAGILNNVKDLFCIKIVGFFFFFETVVL